MDRIELTKREQSFESALKKLIKEESIYLWDIIKDNNVLEEMRVIVNAGSEKKDDSDLLACACFANQKVQHYLSKSLRYAFSKYYEEGPEKIRTHDFDPCFRVINEISNYIETSK